MPIQYTVDGQTGCVRSRAYGEVTASELRAHLEKLSADKSVPRPLREIWDGTEIESFPLTSLHVRELVHTARTTTHRFSRSRLAIASPRLVVYGLGRVAQAFAYGSSMEVQVFRSLPPAEAWIAEAPTLELAAVGGVQ